MSIEDNAQKIIDALSESLESETSGISLQIIAASHAQDILDAFEWFTVSYRISDDEALVMVRLASGIEEKSWYEAGSGWLCEEDHPDDPVVAWRELV